MRRKGVGRWLGFWVVAASVGSGSANAQGPARAAATTHRSATAAAAASDCAATPPLTGARTGARSPRAPLTRDQRIQSLYQRFECHFERKQYAECLPYLEQACLLTDSPRCLLNLGAVHHALMHCQRARSYYEQYLSRSPYDAEGDEARDALDELNRACGAGGATALAPEPPAELPIDPAVVPALTAESPSGLPRWDTTPGTATHPVRDQRSSHDDRMITWSLFGAGAIALTGTLVAAGYGVRAERDYERLDRQNGDLDAASDPRLRAIDRRGRRYNHVMLGLGAASGLLLGAGTTVWLLDLGSDTALDVSADGARLQYRGRF
ncbi:MAG TPA: tetratricopeptide repeat protein [Polyangiaceae bacterium]|nr:tetratricopeptide repeat protein [Polyangiaceae bacterium]